MAERILRRPEVIQLTGLPQSTLYDRISAGDFPRPIKLGGPHSRSVGWKESEVQAWIEQKVKEANHQQLNAA